MAPQSAPVRRGQDVLLALEVSLIKLFAFNRIYRPWEDRALIYNELEQIRILGALLCISRCGTLDNTFKGNYT